MTMSKRDSPIRTTVSAHLEAALANPEVRAEYERVASYEALARIIVARRGALGLTQAELARRMKTTASVISRIESGQHATSPRTLKRLAGALDARAVLGFEFGPLADPAREFVVL